MKRSPSFDRWTVLPSVLTLSLPVFSTLAATLNTSLMHCQMHIQKGQLFFKSACQVHPSPERGFENGWRERERERERERREERGARETEEGGAGDQETSPAHLSDSHLPQRVNVPTALCLLHGRLAAPPSSSSLSKVVSAHSVSVPSIRNTSEPAGQLKGQISERLWGWAMALLADSSPTTAAYYCLIRRRFKRRRKKRCERKGIPPHCTCCSVCLSGCLSVCLSVRRRERLQNCAAVGGRLCWFCLIVVAEGQMNPWGLLFWKWSVGFRAACVVHVVMTLLALL